MPITIAAAFMDEVRDTLEDPEPGSYWTDAELIGYYNSGITAIIAANQEAISKTVTFPLAAGVEQKLPDDAVRFGKLMSNLPYVGLKRTGIIEVSAEAMQDASPDWYGKAPTRYVRHCIPYPAEVEPLRFRIDPPNDGTGQAYLMYFYAPPDATAVTDPFGLTEAYRSAAYHYVVSKALGKGNKDFARSQYHLVQFYQDIGLKQAADTKAAPALGTNRTSE